MKYSEKEVLQFIAEEDVKFIRLAFCDIFGSQKNISIMPGELPRAFSDGIAIDASAVNGFGGEMHADLFLHPDAGTLTVLPWRPEHGKVVRMFCSVSHPDGTPFENDTRSILIRAIEEAEKAGCKFSFGSQTEFYLFKKDEKDMPTTEPHDNAGYMDIAPADKGENVRREICLCLEEMGIRPESSHHEEGPGQNEIDFRSSDALTAADNAVTFLSVVKTIASRNGLHADFSPMPIEGRPGNGFHIILECRVKTDAERQQIMAGILAKIEEVTVFLDPTEESFMRLGTYKAPQYVSWTRESRSQLIRIPARTNNFECFELRSPDPAANPYIAYALLIYAGLYGISHSLTLPPPTDFNLRGASQAVRSQYTQLPKNLSEARKKAARSDFIKEHLPQSLLEGYGIV